MLELKSNKNSKRITTKHGISAQKSTTHTGVVNMGVKNARTNSSTNSSRKVPKKSHKYHHTNEYRTNSHIDRVILSRTTMEHKSVSRIEFKSGVCVCSRELQLGGQTQRVH